MMASGLDWRNWWGRAAACVKDWPFWTEVEIDGVGTFYCLDRGGKIVWDNGAAWIDLLVENPPRPFGTGMDAVVRFPEVSK